MGPCSLYPIVKAVLLIVVSFFVLLGVSKAESKNLKTLGRMLAITLWIISASAIICSIFSGYADKYPKLNKYHHKYKMMKCW